VPGIHHFWHQQIPVFNTRCRPNSCALAFKEFGIDPNSALMLCPPLLGSPLRLVPRPLPTGPARHNWEYLLRGKSVAFGGGCQVSWLSVSRRALPFPSRGLAPGRPAAAARLEKENRRVEHDFWRGGRTCREQHGRPSSPPAVTQDQPGRGAAGAMAGLGHNYNIQCMKLFQELKAAHPATPDETVRQCMKAVSFKHHRCTLHQES
jgi:hypothetical protein